MGRPYRNELTDLEKTYTWSSQIDVTALIDAIERSLGLPTIAVGSGGSYSAAAFFAFLQRQIAGTLAVAATPVDALDGLPWGHAFAAWLFSARGSNVDIKHAARSLLDREPSCIALLTMKRGTPVGRVVEQHPDGYVLGYSPPVKKDGYLATNSLLATCVLLARAFGQLSGSAPAFPRTLTELLSAFGGADVGLTKDWQAIWSRGTLLVIHGSSTLPAALDLESKFTEAALCNVRVADYRSFGHGRHNWLNRHGKESAVLALCDTGEQSIVKRTMDALPAAIPKKLVCFGGDPVVAAASSIAFAIRAAGYAGTALGVDPGRPSVPAFGRKLYGFAYRPPDRGSSRGLSSRAVAAIERKSRRSIQALKAHGELDAYQRAYGEFVERLRGVKLKALALDYDGTLVRTMDRYSPPKVAVKDQLRRLASEGLVIGIATGRGDSVEQDLRTVFPKKQWSRIVLGTHHGSEVRTLDGTDLLRPVADASECLRLLAAHVKHVPAFSSRVTVRHSPNQVSFSTASQPDLAQLFGLVTVWLEEEKADGYVASSSGHSVDVLAPGASKLRVLEAIQAVTPIRKEQILTIGDSGSWPGNDYNLLSRFPSLSVRDTPIDPTICWNLAERGLIGTAAAVEYLTAIQRRSYRTKYFRLTLAG